jgi:uncharacterized protein (DUF1697 family)
MTTTPHVALLRGINVGGKNLISMGELAEAFRDAGYTEVRTHLQSGNVLFAAGRAAEDGIERMLEQRFGIPILVIVRTRDELAAIVAKAPADHASADLRSEVIFLKSPLTAKAALAQVPELREGVDSISAGPGVLYFSRVKARATKTRVQTLMAMPMFKQMTMRTWGTTNRLMALLDEA